MLYDDLRGWIDKVDEFGELRRVDRANTGMHILELTGAARKIANFQ